MIDTSNWKEFRVGDMFDVSYGKFIPHKDSEEEGKIPHITTTTQNNGIGYYVNKPMFKGNAISVASDGNQGASFYQENPFSASNIVSAVVPHNNVPLNEYIAEFICTIFRKEGEKYSWGGFKFSVDRVRETKLKLPATPTGEPDWDYMESYMKNIMEESEKSIENLRKANGHSNPIDVREWGEFRIGDLLEMQKQIELNPIDAYSNNDAHNIRKYPFYGQSSENNGIIDYYYLGEDLLNNKKAKSSIMIHSNTHLAYYVDTPFYLKDGHGATTIFQNESMTLYSAFFIISVLNKTMNTKFDYDVKATKEKLNALVIKLPITSTGEPDWDYMEEYMKNIEEDVKEKVNMLSV